MRKAKKAWSPEQGRLDQSLYELAGEGDKKAVEDALARGADPLARHGASGRSALMRAAELGDAQAAAALIPVSDLEAVDRHGIGLVEIAAEAGAEAVLAQLLAAAGPKLVKAQGAKAMVRTLPAGGFLWLDGKDTDRPRLHPIGRWGACVGLLAAACDLEAPEYEGVSAAAMVGAKQAQIFQDLARKLEQATAMKVRAQVDAAAGPAAGKKPGRPSSI